jgi:hydroxymethylbilane synthase
MRALVVGTRGSALALWQTDHAVAILRERAGRTHSTVDITVRTITTRGDTDQSPVLAGKLGKGFFTQELEAALRSGAIDFAVHSLKDLPTESPPDLAIAAILPRASKHDLLLARTDAVRETSPGQLPLAAASTIGSSSLRRSALIRRYAQGAQSTPLRGNVPTRLKKLAQGQHQAIVLAAAGVERLALDLAPFAVFDLNPRIWVPAPGQGAVAIQCRASDGAVRTLLAGVAHAETAADTTLERLYLQDLEGGCTTPFGCVVDGTDLCVGLDVHGSWRGAIVARAGADRVRLLAALEAADFREATGAEWLYRKHRPVGVQVA